MSFLVLYAHIGAPRILEPLLDDFQHGVLCSALQNFHLSPYVAIQVPRYLFGGKLRDIKVAFQC